MLRFHKNKIHNNLNRYKLNTKENFVNYLIKNTFFLFSD